MKRTYLAAALVALAVPRPAFGTSTPKEQLFNPKFEGIGFIETTSHNGMFAGKTTIVSGSATVAHSTTLASTGWLVLLGQMAVAAANVLSGQGNKHIEVKTICNGAFITFGTVDGVALGRNTDIHWFALKGS